MTFSCTWHHPHKHQSRCTPTSALQSLQEHVTPQVPQAVYIQPRLEGAAATTIPKPHNPGQLPEAQHFLACLTAAMTSLGRVTSTATHATCSLQVKDVWATNVRLSAVLTLAMPRSQCKLTSLRKGRHAPAQHRALPLVTSISSGLPKAICFILSQHKPLTCTVQWIECCSNHHMR
jgi:hypothetical protein